MSNASDVEAHITSNTKILWVETPTNPMMNIIDIAFVGEIAKKHNVLLCVDNTFASPYLQNPLDLGADLVMHSLTKYISGHSDVVMGALITSNDKLYEDLKFVQNASGATPGPQDCFLVLRGIKTLHVRMQRHCENGAVVAKFLAWHPAVSNVYWCGFESHPNHDVAKKQMHDFGGMISFTTKNASIEDTFKLASSFKVFSLAESLGGVESLINHPATMTHASIPKADRETAGVVDSLLRLSVGVEDIEDLLEDLAQALA